MDKDAYALVTNTHPPNTDNEIFECNKCDFESTCIDDFINEIKCDCNHKNTKAIMHNKKYIEICTHCGLIIQNESFL